MKHLDPDLKKILGKTANAIRHLAMDAVQKANSGHPGLPLGCAEIGAYLYGYALRHNPKHPQWWNRDRLVLSAGHGSMWLYACLHLAGFPLSLEEIKHFRQLHSKTPGHPEFGETAGVEATTGPLGQGTGNAVGMALGLKLLGERYNTPEYPLFDAKVFCLCSDGDMMEGVSHEACALAGHLQLNNLIFLYDANNICLDGPLAACASEDTLARFRAYGWHAEEVDGHDLDALHQACERTRQGQTKPVLLLVRTIIGKGSPHKAGTSKAHGSPLGVEEVAATKQALGLPEEPFHIPKTVLSFFENKLQEDKKREEQWNHLYRLWSKAYPEKAQELEKRAKQDIPQEVLEVLNTLPFKSPLAGRQASHQVLEALAPLLPQLYGGSADLSCSDLTFLSQYPAIGPGAFTGRNIKYGVREFGMGTIANGMAYTGFFLPLVGTFLTFSDYLRNAIRLAALSRLQVIYQFTHDSVFLGEDGPTHQPVEHYAALRAIPHLQVIRPADAQEAAMAWWAALQYQGPTALLLSRQPLPTLPETRVPYAEGVGRGAYIVRAEKGKTIDYTLFATGSELVLALQVADALENLGKQVRVVSMPCWLLFEQQEEAYRHSVCGGNIGKRVSIEAGVELGWHKYIGSDGIAICMEGFGASAPADVLETEFGFAIDPILERILLPC